MRACFGGEECYVVCWFVSVALEKGRGVAVPGIKGWRRYTETNSSVKEKGTL